ncbi:DUF488 family protein [Kocuria sp.]|uniref:DUF488 family protein n=1 Tax=Kocuria sp. TaxID=1871328 RepID=UPI00281181C2|nr:DUF488 family protein [Kocuria sp.]
MAPGTVYTVGHSTRSAEELVALLREFGVQELVDIRTVPRSRTNPQFDLDRLPATLAQAGIEHTYCKGLGGLRPTSGASVNTAWRNASFRGYADHMQTEEFRSALAGLEELAAQRVAAIMFAEARLVALPPLARGRGPAGARARRPAHHGARPADPGGAAGLRRRRRGPDHLPGHPSRHATRRRTMQHLNEIAMQHLNEARHGEHGRSSERLLHQKVLRQTLIALREGSELSEHNAPYAGSLQVLHGRIRVRSGKELVLEAGHLHELPLARHSVEALEDAVFLLTAVTGIEDAAE